MSTRHYVLITFPQFGLSIGNKWVTNTFMVAGSKPSKNIKKNVLLAKNLINLRRRKGWTQEQLAEEVGCNKKQVVQWENGHASPHPTSLQALADKLSVTVEQLQAIDLTQGIPKPSVEDVRRRLLGMVYILGDEEMCSVYNFAIKKAKSFVRNDLREVERISAGDIGPISVVAK